MTTFFQKTDITLIELTEWLVFPPALFLISICVVLWNWQNFIITLLDVKNSWFLKFILNWIQLLRRHIIIIVSLLSQVFCGLWFVYQQTIMNELFVKPMDNLNSGFTNTTYVMQIISFVSQNLWILSILSLFLLFVNMFVLEYTSIFGTIFRLIFTIIVQTFAFPTYWTIFNFYWKTFDSSNYYLSKWFIYKIYKNVPFENRIKIIHDYWFKTLPEQVPNLFKNELLLKEKELIPLFDKGLDEGKKELVIYTGDLFYNVFKNTMTKS